MPNVLVFTSNKRTKTIINLNSLFIYLFLNHFNKADFYNAD